MTGPAYVVIVLAGVALAAASVMIAVQTMTQEPATGTGDTMPKTMSKIAYVLLIVLMFGIASGWLGSS